MYAPTAAGAMWARLVRAREKITSSSPAVAIYLGEQVRRRGTVMGGDADRGEGEHAIGHDGAEHAPGYLGGYVGERVAPADAARGRVGEARRRG